jgi:hypothetical protein
MLIFESVDILLTTPFALLLSLKAFGSMHPNITLLICVAAIALDDSPLTVFLVFN